MTGHHPSPEILAEYAAGALHGGAMLVLACHIESCAVCSLMYFGLPSVLLILSALYS